MNNNEEIFRDEKGIQSAKDHNAPIFSVADFGIVGDILTVLPEVIAKVKRVFTSK